MSLNSISSALTRTLFAGLLAGAGWSAEAAEETNQAAATAPALAREFRGVWVATVDNIDWPSRPGLTADQQKAEFVRILEVSEKLKLNAIVFQVRPACDVMYPSKLEPWSEFLTGEMATPPDPFYDPLEFAIVESHKRGMELHAWFNPYRAHVPAQKSPISDEHISKKHPDYVVKYGKHLWLDPGKKEVQQHSLNVIMEVVKNYDVDGVHFDDYFYPYKEKNAEGQIMDFPDEASWTEYVATGGTLARDDWRRENVNQFVESCYHSVKAEKPWVKFGISPFGIWRPGYPEIIKGFDAYGEIYCDSRKWLTNGWVDYVTPQLYWKLDATNQGYSTLLNWWHEQNTQGRHLWPGNFSGRVGNPWPLAELVDQIKATRTQTGASGNIHFSMKSFLQNKQKMTDELAQTLYAETALIPATTWTGSTAPEQPVLKVHKKGEVLTMDWSGSQKTEVWQWVLQTRTAQGWQTSVLPAGKTVRKVKSGTNDWPEMISLTPLNRYGLTGKPAVQAVANTP